MRRDFCVLWIGIASCQSCSRKFSGSLILHLHPVCPDESYERLKSLIPSLEYPFSKQEEQSAALHGLSDVLDEARFKFTHQKKQELAEQNRLLQAQIDAWGLPPKTHQLPLSSCPEKERQEKFDTEDEIHCEKQRTDVTTTQNKFAQLSVEDSGPHRTSRHIHLHHNEFPDTAAPPRSTTSHQ
ncbi:hypothetical protein TNCV_4067401 [Trichonephila clavipes]|nr:hypothetical protein TNCV_4067401 [Trichonephila clavipes]